MVCADAVSAALIRVCACSELETLEISKQLGTLGHRTGFDVVKTVCLLVGDGNPAIRRAAHETLIKIARRGDMYAILALGEALQKSSTREATVSAIKLIAEEGDKQTISVVSAYLQMEYDVDVCLAALDILGHVAGKGNQLAAIAV